MLRGHRISSRHPASARSAAANPSQHPLRGLTHASETAEHTEPGTVVIRSRSRLGPATIGQRNTPTAVSICRQLHRIPRAPARLPVPAHDEPAPRSINLSAHQRPIDRSTAKCHQPTRHHLPQQRVDSSLQIRQIRRGPHPGCARRSPRSLASTSPDIYADTRPDASNEIKTRQPSVLIAPSLTPTASRRPTAQRPLETDRPSRSTANTPETSAPCTLSSINMNRVSRISRATVKHQPEPRKA